MNLELIIVFFYSYTLGSIPFGLIATKLFLKKDIRKIGSGNIGATNVLRTGNKLLAIITLFLDIIKGYLSIYISLKYFNEFIYLAALISFIGHIFPIWLKFKGGKGVATYLGIILALSTELGVLFILVWLIVLFIFKYSSLSSIFSSLSVLLFSIVQNNYILSTYLFVSFMIILYTHKENIIKLYNKNENKIKF